MDNQSLLEILQAQASLGRTQKAWDVGKGMTDLSATTIDDMGKEGFVATECKNCGIVLSGEFFAAGCKNCGCKDFANFGDKVASPVTASTKTEDCVVRISSVMGPRFFLIDRAQIKDKESIKGEET